MTACPLHQAPEAGNLQEQTLMCSKLLVKELSQKSAKQQLLVSVDLEEK